MKLGSAVLFGAILLASCATSGRQISEAEIKSFTVGKSTMSDVEARLGPPTTTLTADDGTQTLSYVYAHSQARPESFIPIAGAFVGGVDSQSSSVSFNFKNGILTSRNQTQSNSGVTSGR
jgi:hypothetical protein